MNSLYELIESRGKDGFNFHSEYGFGKRPLLVHLRASKLTPKISQVCEIIAKRALNKILNNIPYPDCRPTHYKALEEL